MRRKTQGKGERRRFPRIRTKLPVRFLTEDGTEERSRTIDISVGSIAIRSDYVPDVGENIIAYVDRIGRVQGNVIRRVNKGFAMEFEASDSRRDRLSITLTWIANQDLLGLHDERIEKRFVPSVRDSFLELTDGSLLRCKIENISGSGALLAVLAKPAIGESVRLGSIDSHIIHHFEDGVGIEFANLLSPNEVEERLQADLMV